MEMYEEDRLEALEERRRDEAKDRPDRPSLEERFGPGSFGCHEAMHVTQLVVDLIERQLVQHSAVLLNPVWYAQVREAQALLYRAYSAAADEHLGAPSPEGGPSGGSSGMKG
ncbi:hypothetical protein [Shinella granuli]|uniref:Uncharacterized protein n=1 Tax=Shinella granuli TaxID=323621 RepID=A0A4R2BXX5_SHIGR|nr:hypothetical protein [Shinella granuli]TCN32808.1 hypothetical protein EV665_1453 [Shinella granuli]